MNFAEELRLYEKSAESCKLFSDASIQLQKPSLGDVSGTFAAENLGAW